MILEKTEILEISAEFPCKKDMEKLAFASDIIRRGGTVCFPTETVYGLGANALDADAVAEIFKAKGRPQDNPLIIHLDNIDKAEKYCFSSENKYLEKLLCLFPGPITVILKKKENIPGIVTANLESVGVRVPSDSVAHAFLELCDVPVAAPSANISGRPSPTTAAHVITDLYGKVDAIIASGSSSVGLESTIVNLTANPPALLRPGGITYEKLCSMLGTVAISDAVLSEMKPGDIVSAPGMKYKHYAPRTPVFLVSGENENVIQFLKSKQQSERCAVLAFSEDIPFLTKENVFDIGKSDDPAENARRIFAQLRATDTLNGLCSVFVHITDDKSGIRLAVFNRLLKASAYHIINV